LSKESPAVETSKAGPKIVRYFLAAGFLIPCVLYLVLLIGDVRVQGMWIWMVLVPWPTFSLTMAAEAGGGVAGQALAFLISATANVVLYGLLGAVVSFCYRRYLSLAG
jgi:bacteriorhodopsin